MSGDGYVDDQTLLGLCGRVVDAVGASLGSIEDWSKAGGRPGQYAIDLVADRAALDVLEGSGLGVLSEESGLHRSGSPLVAVLDPIDGSTNASRGVPWYATSICVVDEAGPRVAVVGNLATGERYRAIRGRGSWKDDKPLEASGCTDLGRAVVALSGFPGRHLGWAQFRAFGAAALELCAVADGSIDGFLVGGRSRIAPWDYMGGVLVCTEAGGHVRDLTGRDLVTVDPRERRAVAGAASQDLMVQLCTAAGRAGAASDANGVAVPGEE
jgi:fructose-1,6-bisphosphatase/inositol monophosphatase family enzyme